MLSFGAAALIVISSIVIYSIVESLYRWWQTSKGKRRIPCKSTVPIIGNGLYFIKATNLTDLRDILFSYQRDAPLSGAWVFNKLIIMVNEPKYIEALTARALNKPEEIYGIFHNLSNGIFVRNETHFGIENGKFIGGKERFHGILRKALAAAFLKPLQFRWRFEFNSSKLDDESMVRPAWQIVNSILAERRKELTSIDSMNAGPKCYSHVVLQVAKEEGLSEDETIRLAIDMFVAGSDTTSTSISCAIMFLAMHPEYQENVEMEQYEIFRGSRRAPTFEDLNKMKYLEMVIYETLRHIGVPLVARKLDRDVYLDEYCLPSNSILFLRFMTVCRDPRWWERPYEFFPEHFLSGAVAARPKSSFTPFSRGSRSCPGKLYAMISMKVILSVVLREFKFTTDSKFEDIKYEYGLIQTSKSMKVEAHSKVPSSKAFDCLNQNGIQPNTTDQTNQ